MALLRWLLCCTLTAALVLPAQSAFAADVFDDSDGTPYKRSIERLARRGVATGCTDDAFCPYDAAGRGGAAAMLSAAFELPSTGRDHFSDDDETRYEDAINRLAAAGVSKGCEKDTYCLGQRLLRGQMASLLVRIAELPPTKDHYFTDARGVHGDAINRLAAAGITAGCTAKAARFCPDEQVRRGELAIFVARALDIVPRATLAEQLAAKRKKALEAAKRRKARQAERRRKAREARRRKRAAREPRGVWDRLAACEAGGNWSINTGNGYYGGLQFSLGSWRAVGGSGYPHRASRSEQIKRGKRLKARQGWGAWPSCTRKLGLR
ncbi:hypothetical protein BH23ACT10_BH23ACT10_25250 [soil metagenome]